MTISIQEFLSDPEVELVAPYGSYAFIFKIKNGIAFESKTHFAFTNRLSHQSVSFVYNIDSKEITLFNVKDEKNNISTTLTEQDKAFIAENLDIYLERVGREVARLTKQMRADYGREFKSEVLNCHGYSSYIQSETNHIESAYRMNIFHHTIETKNKKRAFPFAGR